MSKDPGGDPSAKDDDLVNRRDAARRAPAMRIARVEVIPVAIPLVSPRRHSDGVTTWAVATLLRLEAENGLVGLGEVGPRVTQDRVRAVASRLVGEDPFALERLRLRLAKGKFYFQEAAILFAGVEMACLDLQGKATGLSVSDLLGGRVRDRVPVIAYIFRYDAGPERPAAATADEVVALTRELVERHGIGTIKLKGGSAPPASDIEMTRAVRSAFPEAALRLDPNGSWTVGTSLRVAQALRDCDLEWLEDPTPGIDGMSEVTRRAGVPTATNMCLTHAREVSPAIARRAVDVVLCDLSYSGGLRSAKELAATCAAFDVGIGVHSVGAELGVSRAAMLHFAATTPVMVHAMDSVFHDLPDDVIVGGVTRVDGGSMAVPAGPGLGVELNEEKVRRYTELYQSSASERSARSPDPDRAGWYPTYPAW